jgi:3',5'-cyclic AMP phosphodiesterase CpdA
MALGSGIMAKATGEDPVSKKKRILRIAHITDVHIRPEHNAPARFRKCLEEIKKHKIDFFLNGGDTIYAADYDHITRERVNEQWEIWQHCRNEIRQYEMHSCLGNHDMWWAAPGKQDPMYGKEHVVKQLGIPHRYYSFDRKGWHFIILDSNNQNAGSLDEEQRRWLENDLANLPAATPVLCLSHYPVLAVCTILEGGNHTDSSYITGLFYKHSDKKITCLSGHVHLQDTAVYNGVQFYCNGALSGYWWEDGDKDSAGKYYYKQTPPGYAIIDLYEDGTVNNQYIPCLAD